MNRDGLKEKKIKIKNSHKRKENNREDRHVSNDNLSQHSKRTHSHMQLVLLLTGPLCARAKPGKLRHHDAAPCPKPCHSTIGQLPPSAGG